MVDVERNWARNVEYEAVEIVHPGSVDEVSEVVARAHRVHALGTRHSFNDCGDGPETLVALDRLPLDLEIDEAAGTATLNGGARMGDASAALEARGWALHNLASLPHISLTGAVATGTHGSGDRLGSLAAAVRALDVVGSDGTVRTVRQGDPDFAGSVVAIGALGVVTRITVAVEPTYTVRQDVFEHLPWDAVHEHLDAITGSAYSVSLFTDWTGDVVPQAFLKSRDTEPPHELFGATPAPGRVGILDLGIDARMTEQGGVRGPWLDRLPHFRLASPPSVGEELQSEYLVPRSTASVAFEALRGMGDRIKPALLTGEIRTVAADDLWLSAAYGTDVVGLHFTWRDRPDLVLPLLEPIEERLLPLGARPHWGKIFAASGTRLRDHYPRWQDFEALRDRIDPDRTFGNAFLDRTFG